MKGAQCSAAGISTTNTHDVQSCNHGSILHIHIVPTTTMSSNAIYTSLLRPPVLHVLRAAGFHATKPAVLDTLVDLTARYLSLLASISASHAQENHNDLTLTLTDVRMALHDVGALWPQKTAMEEDLMGEEDVRGVDNFVNWMVGEEHREIRRVAGLIENEVPLSGVDEPAGREDFLIGTHAVQSPYETALSCNLQR